MGFVFINAAVKLSNMAGARGMLFLFAGTMLMSSLIFTIAKKVKSPESSAAHELAISVNK